MSTGWQFLKSTFKWFFILFLICAIGVAIAGYLFYEKLEKELPDINTLSSVQYQIPLSIFSRDKKLIARFGEKKRIPITIDEIPQRQLNAFIASEDDRFYAHPGVDYQGLLRAAIQLAITGKKKQGGSTITMQVARNFLLSREKTYIRKIKEIILALKIEQSYSKDKILQLYLNKIYLGHRSYGIAAATMTYYGKPLDQLNLAQMAMLAGLPKAPSSYNPISNPERAIVRRNYVLRRMLELEYITEAEYNLAKSQTVTASLDYKTTEADAPYIAEMVRQELFEKYGEELYTKGLNVYTTIDSRLQDAATQSLQTALHLYDQRHGYRSLPHSNEVSEKEFSAEKIGDTQIAKVFQLTEKSAKAKLSDGEIIELSWENIEWARPYKGRSYVGNPLKSSQDIFAENDFIRVRALPDNQWALAQIPEVEGAFVALRPQDGAILALTGGFDFFHNKYNRATQSKRQPGSGFKPIIYATALEKGFTAASIINDAPVVVADPDQETHWKPQNYSHKFYGPTTIRDALRKSRNLISIRILREIGIPAVRRTAYRFGFNSEQVPNSLSLALGSGHATPLQMAQVYSTFANGGFLVEPYLIDKIVDNDEQIIFQAQPKIACIQCEHNNNGETRAKRILSPRINFLMNTLLRDVVRRGTATRAKVLKRNDLAGKTGTTNDQKDTWFNGYTADIAATAWLGMDEPSPLGRGETGGKAALPMWIEFMKVALKDKAEHELKRPAGISSAYVDPTTGLLAIRGSGKGIWEYFRSEKTPSQYSPVEAESDEEGQQEDDLF